MIKISAIFLLATTATATTITTTSAFAQDIYGGPDNSANERGCGYSRDYDYGSHTQDKDIPGDRREPCWVFFSSTGTWLWYDNGYFTTGPGTMMSAPDRDK